MTSLTFHRHLTPQCFHPLAHRAKAKTTRTRRLQAHPIVLYIHQYNIFKIRKGQVCVKGFGMLSHIGQGLLSHA